MKGLALEGSCMSEWHRLARDLLDRGESRTQVATLFDVSEAMICKIAHMPAARSVDVPAWVHPGNRRSYEVLVHERDETVAAAWARKVQGARPAARPR